MNRSSNIYILSIFQDILLSFQIGLQAHTNGSLGQCRMFAALGRLKYSETYDFMLCGKSFL